MHFENGSLLLFRWFGISVYLHWLWVFLAYYEVVGRATAYTSRIWNLFELLALFAIIVLHEFGHALACRQVGGTADRIILWPLGGVALIRTPNRPGALLWSVAAGPLVNVVLFPLTLGIFLFAMAMGLEDAFPNLFKLVQAIAVMNVILLVFNVLPFYPLDGGRILQALLWFVIGQARSVLVASIIGLLGASGLLLVTIVATLNNKDGLSWFLFLGVYLALQAWSGIGRARALAAIAKMPRRQDAACPHCGSAPLIGYLWTCDYCHQAFDLFESHGVCPNCAARQPETQCIDCLAESLLANWFALPVVAATNDEQKRVQSLFDNPVRGAKPGESTLPGPTP